MELDDRLWFAAALTSAWPLLVVLAPDEERLLEARRIAEEILGPLPHADEVEPWDDDPWSLEVLLLDVDAGRAVAAVTTLRDAGFDARLAPGPSPGARDADALGLLVADEIRRPPVVARLVAHVVHGGDGRSDVARRAPTGPAIELERELCEAVARRGLPPPHSDRGPDTVDAVVHRPTGRAGVQLRFVDDVDRDAVIDVVAGVVRARADHPTLRLAPDVGWDASFGLGVTIWLLAERGPGLPGDVVTPGFDAAGTRRRLEGLRGAAASVEVQVVPRSPGDADPLALDLAKHAPDVVVGAPPRIVGRPPRFAVVWSAPPDELDAIVAFASMAAARPDVAAVRVVPASPDGLGDRWSSVDAHWREVGGTVFLRLRDPVLDHDLLPTSGPGRVPWASPDEIPGVTAISDGVLADGRPATTLSLTADAVHTTVLDEVLAAVDAARPSRASALAYWGWRADRAIVVWVGDRPEGHGVP
jgi:hypothetical protein